MTGLQEVAARLHHLGVLERGLYHQADARARQQQPHRHQHAHRQQQAALVEVEDASAMAVSAADRQQNRQLLVCGATVGLTAAGLLFPPLSLLATPLFAYLSVPVYKQALADLKSDRKIQISAFVAVSTTGMWLVRAKVLAALGLLSARVAEKIRSALAAMRPTRAFSLPGWWVITVAAIMMALRGLRRSWPKMPRNCS